MPSKHDWSVYWAAQKGRLGLKWQWIATLATTRAGRRTDWSFEFQWSSWTVVILNGIFHWQPKWGIPLGLKWGL